MALFNEDQIVPQMTSSSDWSTSCIDVINDSSEWKEVAQMFHCSMNNVLECMTGIENTWLWDTYSSTKKKMLFKNDGVVNEKFLFHGTRTTNSRMICMDEVGFDPRLSQIGRWGRAICFAKKASCSHLYAHELPNGSKQLLIAKVLTGNAYECEPDSQIASNYVT